ncbi:MAG: protein-L-isoaspartate(D-aspartate) O-methyltransferase [Candidatus Aenigmatarchaeota archaeon]
MNNEDLVELLKLKDHLKSKKLEKVILETPREYFVPEKMKNFAYQDIPLPIGYGQTISQPSTVIVMTEALDVKKNHKILEIGAGSGWQAAILSKLCKKVYTVDIIPELVEIAKINLKKVGIKNVVIIKGDGSLGLKKYAPYDRIIVTCACPNVPKPLLDQLKMNGKMIIPVGNYYMQEMFIIKRGKKIERKSLGVFAFVPLRGKYGFK